VRAHHGEALVDCAPLALPDLVDRGLHVVVDTAPGNADQRRERAGMGVERLRTVVRDNLVSGTIFSTWP
jgi:hypothetical protein